MQFGFIYFFELRMSCWFETFLIKMSKNFGHLVQPVQLFKNSKFRDYWPTLTSYISCLCMQLAWIIYYFEERNSIFLNHVHTW
jgi:hypothetical protein